MTSFYFCLGNFSTKTFNLIYKLMSLPCVYLVGLPLFRLERADMIDDMRAHDFPAYLDFYLS